MKYLLYYILIFTVICSPVYHAWGQCDSKLTPSKDQSIAYKERTNRCEGFIEARVGAPSLELVGFTEGKFKYISDKTEVIEVFYPEFTDKEEEVFIRAVGLPTGLYYRMDASLIGNERLNWAVDDVLLKDVRTSLYRNVGLFGYREKDDRRTYIPMKVESKLTETDDTGEKRLLIRTSNQLERILWKIDEKGNFEILRKHPLYAGRTMTIKIPEDWEKGEHFIEIRGREKGSPTYNVSLDIYIKI